MIIEGGSLRGPLHERCDVAIVGSGPAGSCAAALLAEAGLRVILLEKGPAATTADLGAPAARFMQQFSDSDLPSLALGERPIRLFHASALGGSLLWQPARLETPQSRIFSNWRIDFGLANIDAQQMQTWLDALPASSPAELSFSDRLASAGAAQLKLADNPIAAYPLMQTDSQSDGFVLPPLLARANQAGAMIYSDCRVDRIELKQKHAIALEGVVLDRESRQVSSRGFRIEARHIVLAAGAISSAALMLRNKLAAGNGQVGENIALQPSAPILASFEAANNARSQNATSCPDWKSPTLRLGSRDIRPDLLALHLDIAGESGLALLQAQANAALYWACVADRGRGRIRLDEAELPHLHYELQEEDAGDLRVGMEHILEIFAAAGAKRFLLPEKRATFHSSLTDVKAYMLGEDDEFLPAASSMMLTSFNAFSSLRASRNGDQGVVDEAGQVREHPGLYATGCSIAPGPVAVDPCATSLFLASRTAQRIIESMVG